MRLHMPGVQAASEALAGTGRTRLRLAPGRCCRLVQAAGGDGVPDVREFKVSWRRSGAAERGHYCCGCEYSRGTVSAPLTHRFCPHALGSSH